MFLKLCCLSFFYFQAVVKSFYDRRKNSGIEQDIASGNLSNAISKSHTLKGNAGNLSVTPLYKSYTEITDFLRQGKIPEAKAKLQEILPVQNKIVETIKKYL